MVLLWFIRNRMIEQSNWAPLSYFLHPAIVFFRLAFHYASGIDYSFSGWNTLYRGAISNSLARTRED